ncbi:hypothetical protein BBK36DRAFT_1095355, partial [Trichoderma citrinoviride]
MSDTSQTYEEEGNGDLVFLDYKGDFSAAKSINMIQYNDVKRFRGVGPLQRGDRILFVDEHGITNRAYGMPKRPTVRRTQEIFWGTGAEARVAWLLIDRAPTIKHEVWIVTQQKLHGFAPHPNHTPTVIALIRSATLKERQVWQCMVTLGSSLTLELIAALDIEVIVGYVCSLAGIAPGEDDPILALEKLHYDLSDDVVLLRRIQQRIRMLSGGPEAEAAVGILPEIGIQGHLDRFKQVWAAIISKLSPGRLADEMEFYADVMEKQCR